MKLVKYTHGYSLSLAHTHTHTHTRAHTRTHTYTHTHTHNCRAGIHHHQIPGIGRFCPVICVLSNLQKTADNDLNGTLVRTKIIFTGTYFGSIAVV